METKKKRGENRRNKEKPAILITTSMVHTHTHTHIYAQTERQGQTVSPWGWFYSKSSNSPKRLSIFALPRARCTSMCCMTSSEMALSGARRRRSFENR